MVPVRSKCPRPRLQPFSAQDSCGKAAGCRPALPGSLGGLRAQESFALTVDKLGGLRGHVSDAVF